MHKHFDSYIIYTSSTLNVSHLIDRLLKSQKVTPYDSVIVQLSKNKHLCVDSLERATTNPTSGGSGTPVQLSTTLGRRKLTDEDIGEA